MCKWLLRSVSSFLLSLIWFYVLEFSSCKVVFDILSLNIELRIWEYKICPKIWRRTVQYVQVADVADFGTWKEMQITLNKMRVFMK